MDKNFKFLEENQVKSSFNKSSFIACEIHESEFVSNTTMETVQSRSAKVHTARSIISTTQELKHLPKSEIPMQTKVPETGNDSRPAVGGAHAFVLFIARSLGLAPLTFDKAKLGQPARWLVSLSPSTCIISCIVVSIVVGWELFGLVSELRTDPKLSIRMRSMTARVVGSCDVLAVVATSATGIYGAPKRARRVVHVLRLLTAVDSNLGIEMIYTQERNSCVFVILTLILWTCLLIDDFGLYAFQAKVTNTHLTLLRNYLAFYLLYYVVLMLEIQFAYTAHAINLRIKRLNTVLETTGRNLSLITDEKKGITHNPAESIRKLSELHGTLCAAAREVDTSFGIPVLIILISTLLHLIVTPYFLILEIGAAHRPHYLVLQTLWCFAHGFRLVLLVEPCHRTKREAARTGDIVGEMLGHADANGDVLRRLEIFSRQLLHRSPDFTAMGVCSLDRPLIASISGAVTTYLVILIQFQKQADESDDQEP